MGRTMTLMRGLPGAGKSFLAASLDGKVLSTDDFFTFDDCYDFDPQQVPLAHQWNQARVENAMMAGESHVIVDNTNIMFWEMKPYILLADKHGYEIEWVEAQTEWAWNVEECHQKNKHGVPIHVIQNMKDKYQKLPEKDAKEIILKALSPWEETQ